MPGTARRRWTSTLVLLILGCSDAPTVSSREPGSTAGPARLLAPVQVDVVTRDVPLGATESDSQLIGVFGGQLSLPGAGLTVVVPAFALTQPTMITVTAVAGREVAYEFEPHGTQFAVPLIAVQRLDGTTAVSNGLLPATLHAGYFANVADLSQVNATALVSELLGTSIIAWNRTASFSIWHFSGYLIAGGVREEGEGEGSQ